MRYKVRGGTFDPPTQGDSVYVYVYSGAVALLMCSTLPYTPLPMDVVMSSYCIFIVTSHRHYVILVYKKESKARVARVVVIRNGVRDVSAQGTAITPGLRLSSGLQMHHTVACI